MSSFLLRIRNKPKRSFARFSNSFVEYQSITKHYHQSHYRNRIHFFCILVALLFIVFAFSHIKGPALVSITPNHNHFFLCGILSYSSFCTFARK